MGSDMDDALRTYGRRRRSRRKMVAGAGAVLLLGAGGYMATPFLALQLAEPVHYAVADGEIREVELHDGTRLTLAAGAAVTIRYTDYDRVVELAQGTIYADVPHDHQRPFRIDAGDARIVDLGTRFEVSMKPDQVRVAVAEGAVKLGPRGWFGSSVDLTVNQAASWDRSGVHRIADISADSIGRWRQEWVEYKGAPLSQVIADLQGLSKLPIRIDSADLASRPVSGRLQLTDPAGQIENLSIIHEFRIRREEGIIVIENYDD